MVIIYFSRHNFDLKNNLNFTQPLQEVGINDYEYNQYLKPFFETLQGFYYAEGTQLRRLLFPQIMFSINGLSISQTRNYIKKNSNLLKIPIQDRCSLGIEDKISFNFSDNEKGVYHRGIAVQNYRKQEGIINISRVDGVENRKVVLGEIVKKSIWIPTAKLSGESIDRLLS